MQTRRLALSAVLALTALWTVPAAAQNKDREYVVASSATYTPFAFENKDKQIVGFLQSKDDILQASTAQDPFKIGALAMENAINAIPGVVTVGLFANRGADVALIGTPDGVKTIVK